jgi:hypothetical protein
MSPIFNQSRSRVIIENNVISIYSNGYTITPCKLFAKLYDINISSIPVKNYGSRLLNLQNLNKISNNQDTIDENINKIRNIIASI